jgi:hypothetical protein
MVKSMPIHKIVIILAKDFITPSYFSDSGVYQTAPEIKIKKAKRINLKYKTKTYSKL